MLISYDWLREYVDIKLPAEKLAEILSMSGLSVASVEKRDNDHIFDIEVTSNRPDWLSVIGVAREVAAITGGKLKIPSLVASRLSLVGKKKSEIRATSNKRLATVSVKVEEKALCPRYTARVMRNVRIGESPDWLKARIEAMGLRPVNNVVDITNFCLFETGEPMHAFDLDKLRGPEVVVRQAKKGEKIVTIDGVERTLDESILIIADKDKPIAIAGVMGGFNTEVTTSTTNILLEAASFDPVSVRRTSRRLGISTESSYRFERKIDETNIAGSSDRAADLISGIAGGEIGEYFDIGVKRSRDKRVIELRCPSLDKILGIEIPAREIKRIFSSLGLKTRSSAKNVIKCDVPHFRCDLEDEIDLIEEAARIYGYGKMPRTLPPVVEQPLRKPKEIIVEDEIRKVLIGLGSEEIITYGLLSKKILAMEGISGDDIIEIGNPLSDEQALMRPDLLTGLLNSIVWNINRKAKDLMLFEIGHVYKIGSDGKPSEARMLSIGITGEPLRGWDEKSREYDFFDLKGMVESLLLKLGCRVISAGETRDSRFRPFSCASIMVNGGSVGVMGEVGPKILDNFGIRDEVYAAEINIDPLLKHVKFEKSFKELPRHPSVFRDISLVVDKEITNNEITTVVKGAAGAILKEIKLIDRFTGGNIPKNKVSLTYRFEYQDLAKTLTDEEVIEANERILKALEEKLGAKLR